MAEIVNLRRVRKAKQRAERAAAADDNRVRHGVSKAERKLAEAKREKEKRALDGHETEEQEGSS